MKIFTILLSIMSFNSFATVLEVEATCEGEMPVMEEGVPAEKIKLAIQINPAVWCGAVDNRAAMNFIQEGNEVNGVMLAIKSEKPDGTSVVTSTGEEPISVEYKIESVPGFGKAVLKAGFFDTELECSFPEYHMDC